MIAAICFVDSDSLLTFFSPLERGGREEKKKKKKRKRRKEGGRPAGDTARQGWRSTTMFIP